MKPPLCGNKVEHDHWVENYWRCPRCARIKYDRDEKLAQSDFVQMIADAVVERLKESKK